MQLVPLHLGGTLVATSNAAPEELYEGGINRAAFLPFIGTLRARCAVVSLDYHDDDVEAEAGVHAGAVVAEAIAAGAVVAGAPGRGSSRDELAELRRRRTEGIDYRRQLAGRERVEVADSGGAVRSSSSGRERRPSVVCGEPSVLVSGGGDAAAANDALRRMWDAAAPVAGCHRVTSPTTTNATTTNATTTNATTTTATTTSATATAGDRAAEDDGEEERFDVRVPVAHGRSVIVPRTRGRCAWFHFDDVCGARGHLGAADYIALIHRFDAIALTHVPVFSTHNENELRRFINLVDVLYERRALLLASLAAASPNTLFRGEMDDGDDDNGGDSNGDGTRGKEKSDYDDDDDEEEEEEEEDVRLFSVAARAAGDGDDSATVRDPVREAVKRRVRREGAWGGGMATVSGEGGSSGRSTTMIGSMGRVVCSFA
jgi:hypothetical protein